MNDVRYAHSDKLGEIAALLRRKDDFIVTTHVNPDPDALGSEVALCLAMERLGKRAMAVNAAPVPRAYSFIDGRGVIEAYEAARHDELIRSAGCVLVIDAGSFERAGGPGGALKASPAVKICIDHHIGTKGCGDVNLVDPAASSLGEILFELFASCGFEMDGEIARCLYTAIVADTRSFQFNNTTPRTHLAAARLLEFGVDSEEIYGLLYERNTPGEAVLLGLALKDLALECRGRLAWLKVTAAMQESAGATANNSDYFLNFLRSIEGVEAMALFRDIGGGKTKVSLRGKSGRDVNEVARAFGGGGHLQASGATLEGPIDEVVEEVLARARRIFED